MGLSIVDRHPVGIKLCDGIRAARMEWRHLVLGRSRYAEHFGSGSLIEADRQASRSNRLEKARRPYAVSVAGVFGLVDEI
jgi:hypothetical protein